MFHLRRLLIGLFVLLILGGLTAAGYAASQLDRYTIYVDGDAVVVRGAFDRVDQVLQSAEITLSAGDRVVPEMGASITADAAISVLRSRSVRVTIDGNDSLHYTHQSSLGNFLREAQIDIGRTDHVLADGRLLSWVQLPNANIPTHLEISRFKTVTIYDNGDSRTLLTEATTVGAVLQEAGVRIFAADSVTPDLGELIQPDLDIVIKRSQPLSIIVDGHTLQTRSHSSAPLDVLAEAGIGLIGEDYTIPPTDAVLNPGDTIEVIRVTEDFLTEDESIPFESLWQPSDLIELDTTGVVQIGREGVLRRRTKIRYENGVEVSRVPDGEWVAEEPVSEILGYGTQIVVRTLDTPNGPIEYWRKVRMRVTSYTAATSGKTRDDPWYGITASGVEAGYGVVAVDRAIVPWRSYVYVPDYGRGFVGDTGGGIIGRWIDLGYDEGAFEWWAGYTDVYYLTPVPEPERINYLLPQALP